MIPWLEKWEDGIGKWRLVYLQVSSTGRESRAPLPLFMQGDTAGEEDDDLLNAKLVGKAHLLSQTSRPVL